MNALACTCRHDPWEYHEEGCALTRAVRQQQAARERERALEAAAARAIELRTGRCLDHNWPLSLCPFGCSGLA
jgi:hypothetical protein